MVQQAKWFGSSLLPFIAAKSIGTILSSDSNASIGVDFIALKKISIKSTLIFFEIIPKVYYAYLCVYCMPPNDASIFLLDE